MVVASKVAPLEMQLQMLTASFRTLSNQLADPAHIKRAGVGIVDLLVNCYNLRAYVRRQLLLGAQELRCGGLRRQRVRSPGRWLTTRRSCCYAANITAPSLS